MMGHLYAKGLLTAETAFSEMFRSVSMIESDPAGFGKAVAAQVKRGLASKGVD